MTSLFTPTALGNKRVLVTGASSGIGRATAQLLAQSGARVVVAGRDAERLSTTFQSLQGSGHAYSCANLSDPDEVAEWVKGLAAEGGSFDGVFHAAGTELVRPIRLTKKANIDELFGSSVMASMGISRAAAQKNVMNDGASLVFMSSVAGQRGTAGMTVYSAAKAAIDALVRSLACELATRRIRVNSIAAGAVATEMHSRLVTTLGPDGIADYERRHLLGFGAPDDLAQAAVFLLSEAARWITGTTLAVDGGYMVR